MEHGIVNAKAIYVWPKIDKSPDCGATRIKYAPSLTSLVYFHYKLA